MLFRRSYNFDVLCAAAACTFSRADLPWVLREGLFFNNDFGLPTCFVPQQHANIRTAHTQQTSAPAALPSLPFDHRGAQNDVWKTQHFARFLSRTCMPLLTSLSCWHLFWGTTCCILLQLSTSRPLDLQMSCYDVKNTEGCRSNVFSQVWLLAGDAGPSWCFRAKTACQANSGAPGTGRCSKEGS